MDFEKGLTSPKIHHVVLNDVPIKMQDSALYEICSRFGKVISITRPKSKKSSAIVEFGETSFIDSSFYDEIFSTTFTPAHNLNKCFQNEAFLSSLLHIFADFSNDNRKLTQTQNALTEIDEDDSIEICVYCYCCSDFRCARCNSAYCSVKCQRLDWLEHKKICSPISTKLPNEI